jgi:hypothetical protein
MRKGIDFARTAFMISISMSDIAGLVVWMIQPSPKPDIQKILMLAAVVLMALFALLVAFFLQLLRNKYLNDTLPGYPEPAGNLVQLLYHPHRKINAYPSLFQPRTNSLFKVIVCR